MQLYELQVTRTTITRSEAARIPKGIIGAVVKFSFSSEWEGLTKTVVFRAGDVSKDVLDVQEFAVIPAECTAEAGVSLEIGVYGVDAENTIAIPTMWAVIGPIQDGADPSGDATTDPTLPVWAQLQERIGFLEETGVSQGQLEKAVEYYLLENPLTADDVGAAPDGYGLGVEGYYSSHVTDLDSATKNGWYNVDGQYSPVGQSGVLRVDSSREDSLIHQTFYPASGDLQGCILRRYCASGSWQPWEWVNPKMLFGEEYRTTERYNGKPVYMKAVKLVGGPNNGEKKVNHGAQNAIVFDVGGVAVYGSSCLSLPWLNYITISASQTEVVVAASANYSNYDLHTWIKYYKTTD